MEIFGLFSTNIFIKKCNLDLKELEKECYDFSEKNESHQVSNFGGYQGHGFRHEKLINEIYTGFPKNENFKLENFTVYKWININKTGNYNVLHNHDPFSEVMLSGVFFVKTPENCGNIIFHDPRNILKYAKDQAYYNNKIYTCDLKPEENMLIIFPPWLDHEVEINKSEKDRISIGFNIFFNFE